MMRIIGGAVAALLIALSSVGLYVRAELPNYRAAFFYAFGPYEFARSMQDLSRQREAPDARFGAEAIRRDYPDWDGGVFLNRHVHTTTLADHTLRSVTTPNNDTLYTSAVLELSATPVELTLPTVGARYLSVALMDTFTDQFAHIGPRETLGLGGTYWIVGPDDQSPVPDGVTLIRATGNDVWLLARTFVAGNDDLDDARVAQQGIVVRPVYPERQTLPYNTAVTNISDADNFLAVTNETLARNQTHVHTARANAFADQGIGPNATIDAIDRFLWALITPRAEAAMREEIEQQVSGRVGWSVPPSNLGFYGEDDLIRSVIALIGFGALRPEDAVYFMMNKSEDGLPLDGKARYAITVPADVPTNAFWSISLYEPDGTGRLFFYENATGRHSLNSGSKGLARNADGSITLLIGENRPDGPDSNWLPTPEGEFTASFRLYLPEPTALSEQWTPPSIMKL